VTNNVVIKMRRIIFCLLAGVMLGACQSTDKDNNGDIQRVAMVSVLKENYLMSASRNVVGWKPGGLHVEPGDKFNVNDMTLAIESAIKEILLEKGYRFDDTANNPHLQVSYLAALEEEVSDEEIVRRFGIMPGFNRQSPDASRFQKGTIVIDIMDVEMGKSVWRGAVQGFAALEKSQDERKKRVKSIFQELMLQFPGKV
jgi:hypothetical protein